MCGYSRHALGLASYTMQWLSGIRNGHGVSLKTKSLSQSRRRYLALTSEGFMRKWLASRSISLSKTIGLIVLQQFAQAKQLVYSKTALCSFWVSSSRVFGFFFFNRARNALFSLALFLAFCSCFILSNSTFLVFYPWNKHTAYHNVCLHLLNCLPRRLSQTHARSARVSAQGILSKKNKRWWRQWMAQRPALSTPVKAGYIIDVIKLRDYDEINWLNRGSYFITIPKRYFNVFRHCTYFLQMQR